METLLIIEDDPSIARGLQMNLELEGYRVITAMDGDGGLALWRQHRPELILLDIMLPCRDGWEVLQQIRAQDRETRILILSAKDQEADKVFGLTRGADDYVAKPFSLAELLARVKAALRRAQSRPESSLIAFGRVGVDISARRVSLDGQPVETTAREFDLLHFFVAHPGRAFSREQLMQAVWGGDYFGTPRTVDNFVARLRLKLEDSAEGGVRHFETVRGVGYRFNPR